MPISSRQITSNLLGLIGAVVGGVLGYYTFRWIYHQGFYGMMIPGALVGLGCGLLAQHVSPIRGVVCALGALALGLFTEWSFFPFADDKSPAYFLKNIAALTPITLGMIAAGAFFAYWLGKDAGLRLLSGQRSPASRLDRQDVPPTT